MEMQRGRLSVLTVQAFKASFCHNSYLMILEQAGDGDTFEMMMEVGGVLTFDV